MNFIYRILTHLPDELKSIEARVVDFVSNGIWIRDQSGRGEDLFIAQYELRTIKKVREEEKS